MFGISDYDWNTMRRAQNDYAEKKLGHPVDEADIKVGYGGAIPGAGADDDTDLAPRGGDQDRAIRGLLRSVGGGAGRDLGPGNGDWTSPFGGDRYLASTAHDLAATQNVEATNRLRFPAAYADQDRGMKALDQVKQAQTKNEMDAGPGQDMAVRALQRQVTGMAAKDEEEGREYWTPMNQGARRQGIDDKLALQQPLTDRAAMGADAKVKSAVATADARIREAQLKGDTATVAALTAARAKLLTSQYGDTEAQSAELDRLSGPLNGLMGAAGGQTGVGTFPPDIEAKIAAYVKAGASREASIAHLKSTGALK